MRKRFIRRRSAPHVLYARVVYEPSIGVTTYVRSYISQHARRMRQRPTPAERKLRDILNSLNHGVLQGRFQMQRAISGRWIVDIYFPEVRLAIEVDGSIHRTKDQQLRDAQKAADCAEIDITLLRVTNGEVFGDREHLVEKLRSGWRAALRRQNRIIGKPYVARSGVAL